jgi:hypothetical protein
VLFGFGNCIGTLRFSNGDIYTGEFNYGKPNGKGAFTYGNGDSYSGIVAEGQRHGSGTYISAAGDKYVGQFSEGKFDGLGVYYFLANNRSRGDIYVGEFNPSNFTCQKGCSIIYRKAYSTPIYDFAVSIPTSDGMLFVAIPPYDLNVRKVMLGCKGPEDQLKSGSMYWYGDFIALIWLNK